MPSSSRRAGKLVVWMLRRGGGWGPGSLAGWVAGWQGARASTAGSSLVARTGLTAQPHATDCARQFHARSPDKRGLLLLYPKEILLGCYRRNARVLHEKGEDEPTGDALTGSAH